MTTTATPYSISYSRATKDYDVLVEGEYIGSSASYLAGEAMATAYISDLARQTAIDTADMLADAAAEITTDAPLLTPRCPGTGLADCGAPVATAGDFCQRCKDVLDEVFIAALLPDPPDDAPDLPPWSILDAYRAAYGQACVVLDEQFARATERAA